MRKLAANISRYTDENITAYILLKSETQSVEDGLGIYAYEIYVLIDKSKTSIDKNTSDIKSLSQRILMKADEIAKLVAMGLGGKSSSDDKGNLYMVGKDLVPNSKYEINGYTWIGYTKLDRFLKVL